jgi:outer membrane protein assembly factor BamB
LIRSISGAAYGFDDPVAIAGSGTTAWILNAGDPNADPPVDGSITTIDTATGALIGIAADPDLHLDHPVALTVNGSDLWVADKGNNKVTEIDGTSGAAVHVVTNPDIEAPDGITISDGRVFVSDSGGNAVTVIDASSAAVLGTITDSDGAYGFGAPSVAVAAHGNVFVASPFGQSPMVTKLSASTGAADWFMCNTNGPYYFSQLSAFAVSGTDLWVASGSGANSPTPGAADGSLTELSTTTGALITTVPVPA